MAYRMVEKQVRADVRALGELRGPVAGSLAAMAYALARRLDDPDESSPAPVAKQLEATLLKLGELAVPDDDLDAGLSEPT